MEKVIVPTKAAVLQKMEDVHRETLQEFAATQRRAVAAEERAQAAETRLSWITRDNEKERASGESDAHLQRLLQENERLHAQLAAARLQILDLGRSATQRECTISELEAALEAARQRETTYQSQIHSDEKQLKSLRASVRELEKELIRGASAIK